MHLLLSFSGGETSAYMTHRLLTEGFPGRSWDSIRLVFANTGQENEETLEFIWQCEQHFGWDVWWIEAEVHHGARRSPTHRVVDYATASRQGQPFEEVIKKYGIPNSKYPDCTRSLKLRPIQSFTRSLGWQEKDFETAVGIRADEVDRVAESTTRNLFYPLVHWGVTKPMVNSWWAAQPFRLRLKGYQGNCKWCWKKSRRKHLTLMHESPQVFEFPGRMERLYGHVGPEFAKPPGTLPEGYRRTFFRGNADVQTIRGDLATRLAEGTFRPADDDAQVFVPDLDQTGGTRSESCEVDFTDTTPEE